MLHSMMPIDTAVTLAKVVVHFEQRTSANFGDHISVYMLPVFGLKGPL